MQAGDSVVGASMGGTGTQSRSEDEDTLVIKDVKRTVTQAFGSGVPKRRSSNRCNLNKKIFSPLKMCHICTEPDFNGATCNISNALGCNKGIGSIQWQTTVAVNCSIKKETKHWFSPYCLFYYPSVLKTGKTR